MVPIPRGDDVKGMRHVRGVMSVPSLNLRWRGRVERSRESANIAAAQAILRAHRQNLSARRRIEGGWHG
jgi:hypothetical protein